MRAASKKWRANHPDRVKELNKRYWSGEGYKIQLAKRQKRKLAAVELLGGKCLDCGGNFPPEVFDFHHVGEKKHEPCGLIKHGDWNKVLEELKQCVLLCANCHRIRTYKDGGSSRENPEISN